MAYISMSLLNSRCEGNFLMGSDSKTIGGQIRELIRECKEMKGPIELFFIPLSMITEGEDIEISCAIKVLLRINEILLTEGDQMIIEMVNNLVDSLSEEQNMHEAC